MQTQIKTTSDGSHTLFVPELNEHYHSIHGAIQESQHVFIKHGFQSIYSKFDPVRILEIGLGTGLNAFLTFINRKDKKVHYTAVEPYPLATEMISNLNYPDLLKTDDGFFNDIHTCDWEIPKWLSDNFWIIKHKNNIQVLNLKEKFNLVYFDAFAPDVQSEMWSKNIFQKIYDVMDTEGILVTYCAKGVVKRTLQSVGFKIESLPGPPGKREMLRAVK